VQKFLNVFLLVVFFCVLGIPSTHAQAVTASTPLAFSVTGTLANCPAAVVGSYQYCFTTTGIYQALNVATWTLAGGSGVAPSITINGATKTLPASFTITAAAPVVTDPTATAPVVSVQ
jgi:hypothetical protein